MLPNVEEYSKERGVEHRGCERQHLPAYQKFSSNSFLTLKEDSMSTAKTTVSTKFLPESLIVHTVKKNTVRPISHTVGAMTKGQLPVTLACTQHDVWPQELQHDSGPIRDTHEWKKKCNHWSLSTGKHIHLFTPSLIMDSQRRSSWLEHKTIQIALRLDDRITDDALTESFSIQLCNHHYV